MYVSYEIGSEGRYTESEMRRLYESEVDHDEYGTFEDWKIDMLKSGVFEQEENKMLEGYHKINDACNISLNTVYMYNPITKDLKHIITDDKDYPYGEGALLNREYTTAELDNLWRMPIDKEVLKQYNLDNNIPFVGAKIEVIKGRKYPIGTQDIIIKLYDYKDKFNRFICRYAETENGLKISTQNIKLID